MYLLDNNGPGRKPSYLQLHKLKNQGPTDTTVI